MKLWLSGLFLLAVAGMAAAQTPYPQSAPFPTIQQNYSNAQAPSPVMYYGQPPAPAVAPAKSAQPQQPAPAHIPAPGAYATPPAGTAYSYPAPGCCEPARKVCVREPSTKTINHVNYCMTCEDFCVPRCSCCLCSCFSNLCGGCCNCDGPYAKYYLVKKVRKEECPICKCVPVAAPPCGGCCSPPPR